MVTTSKERVALGKKIRAHIELADPITWLSSTITCLCGAIASGPALGFNWSNPRHWALALLGALMTGPLGTGFSQSINDYYDRDLDAINDPSRPIPAGLVTLSEARWNWLILGAATLLCSFLFNNPLIIVLAILGLILSAIYSVPPIKLKKHYWLGPPAVGVGYVSLSWIASHLIFAPITWQSATIALINGGLATGLLFLNDIKSVEGDRRLGLKSLAVAIGVRPTLLVAYGVIVISELILLGLCLLWGHPWVAAFVAAAIIAPIPSQLKLYQDPTHENFKRFILASNPFIVFIEFVSAFVAGGYF